MKILILSDIHGVSSNLRTAPSPHGYKGRSGGFFNVEERSDYKNPVLGIHQVLEDQKNEIDLLLCLGDIAHQAKQLPLIAVWRDIHDLADRLRIPNVLAVTGNHDIPSRSVDSSGAESIVDYLKSIYPYFPMGNCRNFNLEYFADGLAAIEIQNCLVIGLNTCSMHGYGCEEAEIIYEKGSITTRMIEKCNKIIHHSSCNHVVVAMHHNPVSLNNHPNLAASVPSGEEFLSQLASHNKNILVVHGHTHTVSIRKFDNSRRSPVIFSSASLCAYPATSEETTYSNQFHIVDFDTQIDSSTSGTIYSWERSENCWRKSPRSHMPYEVILGNSVDPAIVAKKLLDIRNEFVIDERRLKELAPELRYTDTSTIDEVNEILRPSGYRIIISAGGTIQGLIIEESSK